MSSGSGITLLVNPHAGRGDAAVTAQRVATVLLGRGILVAIRSADSVPGTRAIAAEAVQRGDVAVVVIGGDGLCHLVIQELARTPTALGIVAAGTGNDFAAALGLPGDMSQAATVVADALERGDLRTVDLGRSGQRWWATVLCAGFDSAVNDRANRMRWPHGPRRYDLALLAELARLRAVEMTIEMDDQPVEVLATLVAIGNTSTYGGGIPICPRADPQDGLLDLTVVGQVSRARLIRVTPTLRRGEHLAHPAVTTYRARSISLRSTAIPAVTAYADGEPISALPVTATCQPGALRILQTAAEHRAP